MNVPDFPIFPRFRSRSTFGFGHLPIWRNCLRAPHGVAVVDQVPGQRIRLVITHSRGTRTTYNWRTRMRFSAGTKLGTYEIIAPLGAGGMGEVYRPRDLELKREIAIKVLPEAFVAEPDRVARFQREAEILATLNHPHIAAIHDV